MQHTLMLCIVVSYNFFFVVDSLPNAFRHQLECYGNFIDILKIFFIELNLNFERW